MQRFSPQPPFSMPLGHVSQWWLRMSSGSYSLGVRNSVRLMPVFFLSAAESI